MFKALDINIRRYLIINEVGNGVLHLCWWVGDLVSIIQRFFVCKVVLETGLGYSYLSS